MTAHASQLTDALPVSIEAEQALLGALLINEDALTHVGGLLQARHFSEALHARIYQAVVDLVAGARKATLISVGAELADLEMPAGAPPMRAYLARLAAEATTVINARDYAEMIVEAWARRELIAIAGAAADSARLPGFGRLPAMLDELDGQIIALRNIGGSGEAERSSLGAGLSEVIRDAEQEMAGNARAIPSTGFVDLDRVVGGGYRPGRLFVVAGNPGAGKTVFLVASARRVARLREDRPQFGVDVYSLEIDRREVAARMAANAMASSPAPLAYSEILAGRLDATGIHRLREIERRFSEFALTIDATPGLTIEQIESRAKRTKQRLERAAKTLDVVFIDYLQIMGFGDRYKGRKVDEIGEVTKAAKAMAKRLDVCVVLLSQLSRENQKRDDKRPQLFDLRDSGSIEQDADVVIGLHRPSYYDQRDPKVLNGDTEACDRAAARANDLEVILMKNRLGPTTTVNLYCDVARSFLDNGGKRW
ncbi:DnaB-like helicase C-terminal domain-containing protein [Methylocystis sp. JR02]|uniref:replicative DNA helicase n=1 Tax=Methylocystis sp. JR02 TaxID=3046284 RepID=UPI0024B9B330|nr:DnaB-like helicase C-terminal domain-containing protein [Methylocystis sp. JR02]MDJ0449225.1 DnaB-like helicase C-terminal domain-containing protein [Methylocystis sp. JR02]